MADMLISSLRGKWAQGIRPRHFTWILKDQIAVCERLGGKGSNHRPVRRQEEIVWVLNNNFDLTISLVPGNHNLQAYKDLGLAHRHWPIADDQDPTFMMPRIYEQMGIALDNNKRMLIHRLSLGDTVMGFFGGFLIWGDYLEEPTETFVMIERLFGRQIGSRGRSIINTIYESDHRKANLPVDEPEDDRAALLRREHR
ncbi:MAG: hypothetical protein QMB08_02195, partial [Acidimicrobiales bacterium]